MNTIYAITESNLLEYISETDKDFNTLSAQDVINSSQNFIAGKARFTFIPSEGKWFQMTRYGNSDREWNNEFKFRVFNKDLTRYKDFDINYQTKIELNVL